MRDAKWASVKIEQKHLEMLKKLCEKSGQTVQFHVLTAMDNYMSDVFPVWEDRMRMSLARKR